MKFVSFKDDELTVTLSMDEQCELHMAVYHYKKYLEEILAKYNPGELKSMEEDVAILTKLDKQL